MKTKYQLVLIGNKNPLKPKILYTFFERIKELGISDASIEVLDEDNFYSNYETNAPTVALYFGDKEAKYPNSDIVDVLLKNSAYVLPVVEKIEKFTKLVPKTLYPVNGFELRSSKKVEPLVNNILEGFSLLRLSRRLFISYKRSESRSIAIQLYEQLEQAGFDVFLDTHSIRAGEVFQDELWHRLVDTDVVVILNTPGFLDSEWTEKELAKANAMSIGLIQLIWPGHNPEEMSELSIQLQLSENDFENKEYKSIKSHLEIDSIENIVSQIESFRARSLASRQSNLITEFIKSAGDLRISASLQPEKFITFDNSEGKRIAVIPTIGVPHAFTYNQSEEFVKQIITHKIDKTFLLYDHRNIRERWLNHLTWLNGYLPVNSIKITEITTWLKTI